MNMNNLLDPNFYTSIPEWIYIISGFGIIAVCNSIYFCCHSCKYKRRIEKLKIKEFDLEKREIELDRRLEIERKEKELIRREKQKEKDYPGIILSTPKLATYEEIYKNNYINIV